jgi:hypothetical protein
VCFCQSREDAEQVQQILLEWLKERALTLSEEKTRLVHLTAAFDFLGFNIGHYPAPQTSRTGWKLLIKREQRINPRGAKETQGPMEQGTGRQGPIGPHEAQPDHWPMGQLLWHGACQGNL